MGILLNSNLSWSNHITSICTKARKLLGLLYRRFYIHAEPSALFRLYLSLVRPHLEYASDVWTPTCRSHCLAQIPKPNFWTFSMSIILCLFMTLCLTFMSVHFKLVVWRTKFAQYMFKIVHNLISFPPIHVPRHSRIGYSAYLQTFAHTNSFLHSFVPSTISLWNSLHSNVTTSTPTVLQRKRAKLLKLLKFYSKTILSSYLCLERV